MEHQEDTRQKLLDSAKQEFLMFGYQKASLRHICKNAGVTTGALYFFFEDKNDLFDSLVGDFAKTIMTMIYEHTKQEEKDFIELMVHDFNRDQEFAKEVLTYYYAHKDLGQLILKCATGSSYENFVDKLIGYMEERNRFTMDAINNQGTEGVFNECTQHWFSHFTVEAFLHVLSHDFTLERAMQQIEIIVTFMRGGFHALLQKAKE